MTKKKTVQFRLCEADRKELDRQIRDSGLSQQSYLENAVKGAQMIARDQLDDLNQLIAEYYRTVRGIANNINQMAHAANKNSDLPKESELQSIQSDVLRMQKVVSAIWCEVKLICRRERKSDGNTKSNQ